MRFSARTLWKLVPATTIALCSLFAAQSASHLIESAALSDSPALGTTDAEDPPPAPRRPPPSKDGSPLVARNMFCSDCGEATAAPVPDDGNDSFLTHLPLHLVATNLAVRSSDSFASIANTQTQRQGAYRVGDRIPDAGMVVDIAREYVDFRNEDSQRLERIGLDGRYEVQERAAPRAAAARRIETGSTLAAEYVRVIDDAHLEVDRKLIETLRGNPMLSGAQARPILQDGHMNGVRMGAVRPNGLAYAMGLRNGDTVQVVNGIHLESMDAGLELMGKLQTTDHWSIEIDRRGVPVTLQVDLL